MHAHHFSYFLLTQTTTRHSPTDGSTGRLPVDPAGLEPCVPEAPPNGKYGEPGPYGLPTGGAPDTGAPGVAG